MDDGGNLIDAASLATIGALLHFRRSDVTVSGDRVIVHTSKDRVPVPLSIHHIPVSVTFGIFSEVVHPARSSRLLCHACCRLVQR